MRGKRSRRAPIAWAILSVWLIAGSFPARAAMPAALRVSYPAPTASQLPLWIAKEKNFFDKHGVGVELVYVGSSSIAIAALYSGNLDVVAGGGVGGIASYLQGYKDVALFASLNNRLNFFVYSHPSIADAPGLRGKRLGVSRFGGVGDFAARFFLKRSGLDPRKDVAMIQVGSQPELLPAMTRGAIDAANLAVPQNYAARKLGYRELVDMTQSGARYASNAFLSKRSFLVENRARMEAFLRAVTEAIHFIRTRRAESLSILGRYTRTTDAEALSQTYDEYVNKVWPQVPGIEGEDLKAVFEQMGETNPKALEVNPAELIYAPLIENIVKSGFVKELYK
jgi:NitT/TauT family transport system substrate-binding protein